MDPTDILQYAPRKMQKEAEHLVTEIDPKRNGKIHFLLSTKGIIAECVWLEPCFGMFKVVGQEGKGFLTVRNLPADAMIMNQRIEYEPK